MTMELDHIEAFVAIVRQGGFTRASSDLHLSQPAISRRIHLLERELGAPLFERLQAGALLTDAGHAFLPHAEALLAAMRDGVEAVRALEGGERGQVTLAVVGTLASTPLTGRLRRFREAHPAIDLRLRTALSPEVSDLVLRGDATLGLRYGHDPSPHLEARKIHDEPMLPVCAPEHRLAGKPKGEAIEPKELEGETWITFPPRPGIPREPYLVTLERLLAAAGLGGTKIQTIDSLTAQKRMVEAGFGLALLPESSVDEELRSGSLRELNVPALRATIPVVLIQRKKAFRSGATKALVALLEDWADPPSRERSRACPAQTGMAGESAGYARPESASTRNKSGDARPDPALTGK